MDNTTINEKTFECDGCGCNVLEEIMEAVIMSTDIAVIEGQGKGEYPCMDYGDNSTDCGEVVRIQCKYCGKVFAHEYKELMDKFERGEIPVKQEEEENE